MITDFLLNLVASIVEYASRLLPTLNVSWPTLPLSWLESANFFVPIGPALGIAVAVLLLGVPMLGVSFVLWVIALVRGGSSRG